MLSIRIVSAGAVAAIAIVLAVSTATAQTAASDQVGQPMSLLAGLRPPHAAKTHEAKAIGHVSATGQAVKRTASRKSSTKAAIRLASRKHNKIAASQSDASQSDEGQAEQPPQQTAATARPPNSWPAVDATLPAADAVPAPDSAMAAPQSAPPDSGLAPSAFVVNGQTVQVTSPDQVNDMDLAADNNNNAAAASHVAFAAPVPDTASQSTNEVGSASWIAQVLAALGGAVAAGAVAWFLIGSGPVRTYG